MAFHLDEVERADRARDAAMLAADVAALDRLLDDELVWAHASAATEDKESFIAGFRDGRLKCFSIRFDDVETIVTEEMALRRGVIHLDVEVSGNRRQNSNLFSSVWRTTGDGLRLLHWHSTRASS